MYGDPSYFSCIGENYRFFEGKYEEFGASMRRLGVG